MWVSRGGAKTNADAPMRSAVLQQTGVHQAPAGPTACSAPTAIHASDRPRGLPDAQQLGRASSCLSQAQRFHSRRSSQRANGWKTAKRPGVDYFLAYLSQFYEIVLFTTQPSYTAMGVADKLDPFQAYLPYKLYRESTRYVKGKIVKVGDRASGLEWAKRWADANDTPAGPVLSQS